MVNSINLDFRRLVEADIPVIFDWLEQDHVIKWWDNSQEHREDILNFVAGRKTVSNYVGGKYVYWLAHVDSNPFALIMTLHETDPAELDEVKRPYITAHSYSIEYMIGNPDYLGKGYASQTLVEFIKYFYKSIDQLADTFLIDPDVANTKARHVYEKAGFQHVCDFIMTENSSGAGKSHSLLIKKVQGDY